MPKDGNVPKDNADENPNVSSADSHNRKLEYRKLLDQVQLIDESLGIDTIEKVQNVIKSADGLLSSGAIEERAKHPSENVLGSKLLLATSSVVTRFADTVSGNTNVYDPEELANNILNNREYWDSVIIPGRVMICDYIYGTFDAGPTEQLQRKPRKKVVMQKFQEAAEPENITLVEKKEEDSEMVKKMYKWVCKHFKNNYLKPINFFHFVLHPTNFGRTIENIYHVSFLIRDGFVAITIDETEGIPYISPVSKESRDKFRSQNVDTKQFVLSLDMEEWEEALKVFNIKKPLIEF